MPAVNFVVSSETSQTVRARQVSSMFDVPISARSELCWNGIVPIEDKPWNVGLIVGPSGCGKTSVMRNLFGEPDVFDWNGKSVIDDFPASISLQTITDACSAVGFNTIPAWMRPYHVLSNGEKFRVDLARRLCVLADPIVVDEFTSVVDRQVAKIGSHALQKLIRKQNRKFVAVSCHYDIIDWLQPDWVLEPATMTFQWRSVQSRPSIEVEIRRCDYNTWRIFAPFHYMSSDLHVAARCFAVYINNRPVAFSGCMNFPHPKVKDIMRSSRLVCLPDWQGLGLAMLLGDTIGSAYKAIGKRFRHYPAHPSFIRAHDRSRNWTLCKEPGTFQSHTGKTSSTSGAVQQQRPCAVFEYIGPAMDKATALRFLSGGEK